MFVFTPDDPTESRGADSLAPRDNVVLEMGMFIGRFAGRERAWMLRPDKMPAGKPPLKVPSDLLGMKALVYHADREIEQAMGPACTDIRKAVKRLGPR